MSSHQNQRIEDNLFSSLIVKSPEDQSTIYQQGYDMANASASNGGKRVVFGKKQLQP